MNHRKIDEEGLIIPYDRERQFNLIECVSSLENLLAKKQAEGVNIHYAHHFYHKELTQLDYEIITYRAYLVGRCSKSKFDSLKSIRPGELFIEYRIVRLEPPHNQEYSPFPAALRHPDERLPLRTLQCRALPSGLQKQLRSD